MNITNAKQVRAYGFDFEPKNTIRKNGTVVYRFKIVHPLGKSFVGSWFSCLKWARKIAFGA
jgi:hypothetical protein